MKLLVIGGSGFFGKSILDAYSRGLLKNWGINEVAIIARRATSLRSSHPYLVNSGVTLIDEDIATCSSIPHAEFVIHAAASTDAANYLEKPLEERRNILAGTMNYCKLASKYHLNSKIVYCSSGAVYGQQLENVFGLSEESPFNPIDKMPSGKRDYAAAKRDAEYEIQKLGEYGLSVSIARCFAFVGPYLKRDQHFAIGNFIEDGLQNRSILVKASNAVVRSYMYADDLVVWLMTLASHANVKCPIINVGSEEAIDIVDLANEVANYFGVQVTAPVVRDSNTDRYIPSTKKAFFELGLSLKFNLIEAIDVTTRQIKNNQCI